MFGVAMVTERFGDRENNQTCVGLSLTAAHISFVLLYLFCLLSPLLVVFVFVEKKTS